MSRVSQAGKRNGEGHFRRRNSMCKDLKVRDGKWGQGLERDQMTLAFGLHDNGVWTLKGFRQDR